MSEGMLVFSCVIILCLGFVVGELIGRFIQAHKRTPSGG